MAGNLRRCRRAVLDDRPAAGGEPSRTPASCGPQRGQRARSADTDRPTQGIAGRPVSRRRSRPRGRSSRTRSGRAVDFDPRLIGNAGTRKLGLYAPATPKAEAPPVITGGASFVLGLLSRNCVQTRVQTSRATSGSTAGRMEPAPRVRREPRFEGDRRPAARRAGGSRGLREARSYRDGGGRPRHRADRQREGSRRRRVVTWRVAQSQVWYRPRGPVRAPTLAKR